jgi:hypothetical protein
MILLSDDFGSQTLPVFDMFNRLVIQGMISGRERLDVRLPERSKFLITEPTDGTM